ncbi:MAG: MogA/MoaB family molybdenum cofactor biosynthesis protein [Blastocatellia bacterium]|nr:MogA/MoaB family molybdenum cofactor biosynthesis protein [Blastocatellia bacterium]
MGEQTINCAIVTISDTRTAADDKSGDALPNLVAASGFVVVERSIVADDRARIAKVLRELCYRDDISLILTTGGTGISPRDVTPEATRDVVGIEIPGIAEAMRRETAGKTRTAMLSRGLAGIANSTLIVNLPGSPNGVVECYGVIEEILRHALNQIAGRADHG